MLLQEPVQAAIWDALNHYCFGNAIFLAERLYAEVSNHDALHLLATAYFRGGHPVQAYTLLQKKSSPSPQCKFLMAKCCLEIKKYAEVERLLAGTILTKPKSCEEIETEFGPMACYVFEILAEVYSKTDRVQKACEYYKKSLRLNPLLWKSYEALCHLGAKVDAAQVFSMRGQIPAAVTVTVNGGEHPAGFAAVQVPSSMPPPHSVRLTSLFSEAPVDTEDLASSVSLPHTATTTTSAVHTPTIQDSSSAGNTGNTDCTDSTPDHTTQDLKPADLWAPRAVRVKKQPTSVPDPVPVANRHLFHDFHMSPSFGVMTMDTSCETELPTMPFISPTPTAMMSEDTILDAKAPSKKVVTRKKQSAKPPVFSLSGNSNTREVSTQQQCPNPPSVRRSSRLFGSSSSVKENNKSQGKSRFTSPKGVGRKAKSSRSCGSSSSSKGQPQDLNELNKAGEAGGKGPSKAGRPGSGQDQQQSSSSAAAMVLHMQQQSLGGLLRLLLGLGKAYSALTQYECAKAVELFEELPEHQLNTAWVLSHIGRAYFERFDFQKAATIYSEVRQLEPYQLLGMDRYSTSLWHLQREVELSALAHDLSDLDKNCPQTWCAIGNCFSLQKEHDVAIKFFKRAIQVDPDYAYAYTLLAHEYVFIEELDKALACFRNGLRVDSRHYNAWYGVGMIYYKQEKFSLAEVHFRRALAINPQSCALLCHVGVAQHAQKKTEQALSTLNRAIAIDPRNSLCKFHKASILLASDKHKEALKELEELKQIIPTESLVYFLMGKVHKKLGNTHLAMMNFSWATDLDPKGVNNQIKEAIDKRYATEEDDTLARLTESMPESSGALGEEDEGQDGVAAPPRFLTPEEVHQQVHQDLQAIFGSEESL